MYLHRLGFFGCMELWTNVLVARNLTFAILVLPTVEISKDFYSIISTCVLNQWDKREGAETVGKRRHFTKILRLDVSFGETFASWRRNITSKSSISSGDSGPAIMDKRRWRLLENSDVKIALRTNNLSVKLWLCLRV